MCRLLERLPPKDAVLLRRLLAEKAADKGSRTWAVIRDAVELATRPDGGEPGTGTIIHNNTYARHVQEKH